MIALTGVRLRDLPAARVFGGLLKNFEFGFLPFGRLTEGSIAGTSHNSVDDIDAA